MPKKIGPIKPNDLYQTPPVIWRPLLRFLALETFSVDPCSPMIVKPYNIPADVRYTEEDNGLLHPWGDAGGHVLLNPPYSQYEVWAHKAIEEANRGVFVWALLNQSNSSVWQDVINPNMKFKVALRSRVKFIQDGEQKGSPRYDNYIVHFGPDERYRNLLRAQPNLCPWPGELISDVRKVGPTTTAVELEDDIEQQ